MNAMIRRPVFLLAALFLAAPSAAAVSETTAPSSTAMRLLRTILPKTAKPSPASTNGNAARTGTQPLAAPASASAPNGPTAPTLFAQAPVSTATAVRSGLAVRRLQTAYRASGVTTGQLEKLLALDMEVFASRFTATPEDIARTRKAREQILGAEKSRAVRQYVRDSFLARKAGLMPPDAVGPGPGR